ncbi:extracellular solute-binding protein [uncultured Castellaniella sp.]|uniref:ABC transporter substrate-binding protein n=1 Tax=uncultured Castellaniella sp. TaxID=647907 RepID=UPI00261A1221|nr:extracellular solute-binding protein [uncultured Castellaniella sp.]
MKGNKQSARHVRLHALAGALALACAAVSAQAAPVALNIVDVAGNLAVTQKALESFRDQNPDLVSTMTFTNAPAPQIPGKIKAMQKANRADIDLVLTGTDALAAGIEQDLWVKLLPDHQDKFKDILNKYHRNAARMQELAKGYGLEVSFMQSGPLLEYNPDKVKNPPKTPAELLAWCKANPGQFLYARPANSGPGRTFLMGLPYLLGDKDPYDPIKGWDNTWKFLKELNECVPYYPGGTSAIMKELGQGSRTMTPTVTGWDINPRALGIVPADFKIQAFDNFTWVNDAHYMVIPKGVSKEKQEVLFKLMDFMMQPKQQAMTYDSGYFYPGPAIRDVPLSAAPKESQDIIAKYGRPEYEELTARRPSAVPLDAKAMVAAFHKWDTDIGALKK